MKQLQQLLDKYVHSEEGAEVVANLQLDGNIIADMLHDPEKNVVAYQLLGPPLEMAGDRVRAFELKDFLEQKDKGRLALRTQDGSVIILTPPISHDAIQTQAFYGLDPKAKELLRSRLENFLRPTE